MSIGFWCLLVGITLLSLQASAFSFWPRWFWDCSDKDMIKFAGAGSDLYDLQRCIKNRGNIDVKDDNGYTPLMITFLDSKWPNLLKAQALIDAGADVCIVDNDGKTAYNFAARTLKSSQMVDIHALKSIRSALNVCHTEVPPPTSTELIPLLIILICVVFLINKVNIKDD